MTSFSEELRQDGGVIAPEEEPIVDRIGILMDACNNATGDTDDEALAIEADALLDTLAQTNAALSRELRAAIGIVLAC